MPVWLIVIISVFGFSYLLLGLVCYGNYRDYNRRTKPPTGQVPVEEHCVIKKEYLNSYAK